MPQKDHETKMVIIFGVGLLAPGVLFFGALIASKPRADTKTETALSMCQSTYALPDSQLSTTTAELLRDVVYGTPVLLAQVRSIDCLPVLEAQRQYLQAAP